MKAITALLFSIFCVREASADILVQRQYQKEMYTEHRVSVQANSWIALPITSSSSGTIEAQIKTLNETFRDGSAFLCSEQSFRAFQAGRANNCLGQHRVSGPFNLSISVDQPGTYYLLLDNRFSLLTAKQYQVSVQSPALLSANSVAVLKKLIFGLLDDFRKRYQIQNFQISIQKCGLENAFSTLQNGDIIICSEVVGATIAQDRFGALVGVMLHELGHSLLNLWGLPNFANEETVDELATYFLMQTGDPNLAEQFASYLERENPWIEASRIIQSGDTHPISAQRARNIRRNVAAGPQFTGRWNKALYPHMTNFGLRSVVENPSPFDDPMLARKYLLTR